MAASLSAFLRHAAARPLAGVAAVLAAAALWGTTGTAQAFAPPGAAPIAVAGVRVVVGGMVLLACAIPGGGLRDLCTSQRATWRALALGAVCVAGYQVCFFAGVARTGVAVGTVVALGCVPVFAGVLARCTSGARLTRRWLLSTLGAVVGCAALVAPGQDTGVRPGGVALALLSGLAYAVYAICAARVVTAGGSGRAVMGVLFGGGGLLLVPLLLQAPTAWLLGGRGIVVALHLAVLTTAVAYLLYARGLRTVPVATATTLTLAEPVVAALLGVALLGERLGGTGVVGLVLLGLSLAVLTIPGTR